MPTIVPRAPKPTTSSRTTATSSGERLLDRGAGDRDGEGGERAADDQGAEGAADQEAEVHLPGVHRRGEDVVDEAVAAGLVDRARVVRVGGLRHRHRDQAGDDEDLVVEAVDLADAAAEREAEDDDEEQRGDDRRQRRLRPQLEHAVALAAAEPVGRARGSGSPPRQWRGRSRHGLGLVAPRAQPAGRHGLQVDLLEAVGVVAALEAVGGVAGDDPAPADQRDLLAERPRPPRGSAWSAGSSCPARAGGGCSARARGAARRRRPAVGSSRITRRGSCSSARASSRRRRMPPESFGARTSRLARRSKTSIIWSARSAAAARAHPVVAAVVERGSRAR